jgi:hypothetical protein
MKILITLTAAIISMNAFASESYRCIGKQDKVDATIDLEFESNDKVKVTTSDNDYTLDYSSTNNRYKVFGDYGYDGYGGSVELLVPKDFTISGSDAAEEFRATFKIETYSELGHVGTTRFNGGCQRLDN